MPDDANFSLRKSAPYRSVGTDIQTAVAEPGHDTKLRADNLLLEEFTHASVMAYQVNADRSGLLSLYLLFAGILVTASGIAISFAVSAHVIGPILAVTTGLILAGIMSFGFFIRLLQLSRKYHDSLLAMSVIKEYYIQQLRVEMPHLHQAFRWRLENLPAMGRSSGTTFFTGSIMAVIGSFYFGAATELLFYYTKAFGGLLRFPVYFGTVSISGFAIDFPVFCLAFGLYCLMYWRNRHIRRVHDNIAKESAKFGLVLPAE